MRVDRSALQTSAPLTMDSLHTQSINNMVVKYNRNFDDFFIAIVYDVAEKIHSVVQCTFCMKINKTVSICPDGDKYK